MSGVEAVGLALGIIPLIISALEHYNDGKSALSTWRRHVRVIQSLLRNLKTEHGKLYNTCETLLGGIVSPAKLEPMLSEPFGSLWQDEDTKERVERRLDHMYSVFQETIRDMLAIMEELKSNLGLNTQGQPEWYTGGTVKRNLMRASLVIKRSSYDEALQELISKNQTLETIVLSSLRLEPSRGKRSRAKYLEPFRRIASSIYRALQLGLCGACPQKHGISLQLFTPRLSWRADEESIIGKLDFHAFLSHYHRVGAGNSHAQSWNWKEVKLQVDVSSGALKRGFVLPSRPATEATDERRVTKRVRIAIEGDFQAINPQVTSNSPPEAEGLMVPTPPPRLMADKLCQALSIDSFRSKTCGYLTDPSVHEYGRFSVSHIDNIRDSCELTFVSLRDVMKKPTRWRPKGTPSLPQKLAMASVIASGILQLQDTPWLSMTLTSEILYLAKVDEAVSFTRTYISRTAPEDGCCHRPSCPGSCEHSTRVMLQTEGLGNELMWALFVLLIEVILWRAMDDIISEGFSLNITGTLPKEIFDYTTERGFGIVRSLLSKVAMTGGQEYCNAVESCLKLAFGYPSLDLSQEEMRQQISGSIITPIEESWESSKTLTIVKDGFDLTY
ncbi:hypothetical protein F5Y03DRAFT_348922 [Xylaria venustula]|nr:hypothetical protein F5Y03DRAFT_348922 [Xylaria venustula]